MRLIFLAVVKISKPFSKTKNTKHRLITRKQSHYPTKTPCELKYDDTDSDIVIDCVILKILKALSKSLASVTLTKEFRPRNFSLCVSVSKKNFPHSFQ